MSRINEVMNKANKHKGQYLEHESLWVDSRTEFMHYFLTYGRNLTPEEIDSLEEDERAIKKQYPGLDQFRQQIDYYEGLHEQLKHIQNIKTIHVITANIFCWFKPIIIAYRKKSPLPVLHCIN